MSAAVNPPQAGVSAWSAPGAAPGAGEAQSVPPSLQPGVFKPEYRETGTCFLTFINKANGSVALEGSLRETKSRGFSSRTSCYFSVFRANIEQADGD